MQCHSRPQSPRSFGPELNTLTHRLRRLHTLPGYITHCHLSFLMHLSMLSPSGAPRAYVEHLIFFEEFLSKPPPWGQKNG